MDYFKYLCSLCIIYPVDTTYHPVYQGEEPEWCPYVLLENSFTSQKYSEKKADFVAVIYRNDIELSKHGPIFIDKIFVYVKKRYVQIEYIGNEISKCHQKKIEELKEKHILLLNECDDYICYLKEFEKAMEQRNVSSYEARIWSAIMHTTFEDEEMQKKLKEYQIALKESIAIAHKQLQKMEFKDFDLISLNLKYKKLPIFYYYYHYEIEKIGYLKHGNIIENNDSNIDDLINEKSDLNNNLLKDLLTLIDNGRKEGYSSLALRDSAIEIDERAGGKNSLFERLLLKIIENIYSKYIEFDYTLNDWHLYVQFIVAQWMLLKDNQ